MLAAFFCLVSSCIPKVPHTPTDGYDLFHAYCGQLWPINFPEFEEDVLRSEWTVKLTKSKIPRDTMLFPVKSSGRKVIFDRINKTRSSNLAPVILQYEVRSQSLECNGDARVSLFKDAPSRESPSLSLLSFGFKQTENKTSLNATINGLYSIEKETYTYGVTHLYTFIYFPDTKTVEILFDAKEFIKGSLSEIFGIDDLPFELSDIVFVGFDIPETTCDIGINSIYYGSSLSSLYQWNNENYNIKKGAVTPPPPPKSIAELYKRLLDSDPIMTIFFTCIFTLVPLYTAVYLPFISKEGRELSKRANSKAKAE